MTKIQVTDESGAINIEILHEMNKIFGQVPHIASWACLDLACERVAARRNGTAQLDPDPTGDLAAREEHDYSHSDAAHQ